METFDREILRLPKINSPGENFLMNFMKMLEER
jgi:hypothetical protein